MPKKKVRTSSPQSNFLSAVDTVGYSPSEVPKEFEVVQEFTDYPKPIHNIICPDCGAKAKVALLGYVCPVCTFRVPHTIMRAKKKDATG